MSIKNTVRGMFGGKHSGALTPGTLAPEISLQDTTGKSQSLEAALKKGPVVAAFFKVSCPVCQFTFPFLERMYETFGDTKITFWGISQDEARDTCEYAQEFGTKFPMLIDDKGYPVSNQYGLTNVPSVFLISPDGNIQVSSVGFSKADLERIAVEAARASGKPAQPLFKPGEVVPDYKPG